MIRWDPIACPNVERYCYLFFQSRKRDVNVCFGRFIEQENDAGEFQFIFEIDRSKLSEDDLKEIILPGIDLNLPTSVYVRSYYLPYYVVAHTFQDCRADKDFWLRKHGMTHNDRFEYMMRSRAISCHTNCYLGRTPTDFIDYYRAQRDPEYLWSVIPNVEEKPGNGWHNELTIRVTETKY